MMREKESNHAVAGDQSPPRESNSAAAITQIRSFSAALSNFLRRHDDLQNHINYINSKLTQKTLTLDSPISPPISKTLTLKSPPNPPISEKNLTLKSPPNPPIIEKKLTLDSPPKSQTLTLKSPPNPQIVEKTLTLDSPISPLKSQTLKSLPNPPIIEKNLTLDSPISPPKSPKKSLITETCNDETYIESLCGREMVREVRRYISNNLLNVSKLREEVPRALTRAPNPAQFVLNAIGRFYLQGIRAFHKDSPMIPARRVSVLILEFYLLMDRDGTHVDAKTTKEAHQAAVDWRRRLLTEDGLAEADKIDGRGLLLLIGGFGIPKEFTSSDIRDLIFAGNVSEIADAIRKSSILLERVPGIIEKMMKNKKDSKVADVIYTFGMENKYSPTPILVSFVEESTGAWDKSKKAAHGSLTAQRDADKRHLADVRSVLNCLKKHKLNSSEILPDCPLTEKISSLEKAITDLNKKIEDQVIENKRLEPKSMKRPEWREDRRDKKRSRLSDHTPCHMDRDYLDRRISSDRFTPIRVLDSAFPGHLYPPYEMHRPLPEIRQTIASNGEAYRWNEDAVLRDRILRERVVGQNYPEPSSLGMNGLFRQNTSLEGFAGLPNPLGVGTSSRVPALNSDLYQFADAVAERESFGGARDVPSVVLTHRFPRLY